MRYYIKEGRLRRQMQFRKTMLSMLYIPFHSIVVSTLVQKLMVDHAVRGAIATSTDDAIIRLRYWEILILAIIQLISLGLLRWADVTQTRYRGRTGGYRQDHRLKLLKKFLNLDYSEHWDASGSDWLYAQVQHVDTVVMSGYWQVYILFQSLFALFLSWGVAVTVLLWSFSQKKAAGSLKSSDYPDLSPAVGVALVFPFSVIAVLIRRKLTWA
eukprot:CAMPEP_0170638980 /NCGR_PEP_ID=MMETSP0224-20130122/39374_1 /TAXON_ID=285029 /ORGANISM="Togula jolla, Strain CCCM 725" /LENGTH=212 /DNA_ID=CAMNT_0010969243 /DNA_START=47 /DNA_END=682 /DNA_ORIENTATION=-